MCCRALRSLWLFFFNDTATTEIYTLSLHDALPIFVGHGAALREGHAEGGALGGDPAGADAEHDAPAGERVERSDHLRSEEHMSELQSQSNLVCRLLLEKKKKTKGRARPHDHSQ